MQAFKAHVRSGRIVADDPTDLPEGTELQLLVANEFDFINDDEREALHEALAKGSASIAAGRTMNATEFLDSLDTPR